MRRLGKLAVAALAAAAPLFAASAVKADTVTFSTTGSFSGSDAQGGGSELVFENTLGTGTTTLKFTGVTNVTLPSPGTYTSPPNDVLGSFTVSTTGTGVFQTLNNGSVDGDSFTLDIDQTAPPGSGSAKTEMISGTLVAESGVVYLSFTDAAHPDSPVISFTEPTGSQTYVINNTPLLVTAGAGTSDQEGVITFTSATPLPTPLPASAVGGLGLCGIVLLGKLRKAAVA